MERSWRAGQRILVNLLVENNKLCELYPLKRNSCDDMDSIRLQAKDMYALQDYVDAQNGGPGKGWYRIVKNPAEARTVINAGKLAVVMGIETSVPFGCTEKLGVPDAKCTDASIDRQLDEVQKLGVQPDGAGQQVRQRAVRCRRRHGLDGLPRQHREHPRDRVALADADLQARNDPEVHDRDQDNSVPVDSNQIPAAGRAVRRGAEVLRRRAPGACRSTRPSTTATSWA